MCVVNNQLVIVDYIQIVSPREWYRNWVLITQPENEHRLAVNAFRYFLVEYYLCGGGGKLYIGMVISVYINWCGL